MSQKKTHKLVIRQKQDVNGIMTGVNTEVLLDGKPLKYVNSVSFSVTAGGVAQCYIGIMANVEIEGAVPTELSGTVLPTDNWHQYNGNGVLERTSATINGVPNDTISAQNIADTNVTNLAITNPPTTNTAAEQPKPLSYPQQHDARRMSEEELFLKGWIK